MLSMAFIEFRMMLLYCLALLDFFIQYDVALRISKLLLSLLQLLLILCLYQPEFLLPLQKSFLIFAYDWRRVAELLLPFLKSGLILRQGSSSEFFDTFFFDLDRITGTLSASSTVAVVLIPPPKRSFLSSSFSF